MWQRVSSIITNIRKIWSADKRFTAPQEARIVVIDATNVTVIAPLFRNEPYEVIDIEWGGLYLTVGIARSIIKHLWYVRRLKVAYIAALLDQIRPAIAVTFIDNGVLFQQVSRYYRKARFLAVQNGSRLLERDNPPGSPPIFHTEFACLGRYEIDRYTRHGAQVRKYYPIGSLKDSYYRARYGRDPQQKRFDVCLVSQVRIGLTRRFGEQLDAFAMLAGYVKQFCREHSKTLCVALRKHPESARQEFEWEHAWFREQLGEEPEIFPNIKDEYTSYQLMDQSLVSIGMHSTVMREGFGRHNRILSCNFTNEPVYNFPIEGIWALNDPDYPSFAKRVLSLLNMTDAEYAAISGEWPEYLIGYDRGCPTHEFLGNLIAEAVRGAPVS
jgi:surface carbohydrate biosynthesis protein